MKITDPQRQHRIDMKERMFLPVSNWDVVRESRKHPVLQQIAYAAEELFATFINRKVGVCGMLAPGHWRAIAASPAE
jgi:hypothetical protein